MNRAVVFEKEYLRNSDLLEAFARSLPHFISDNPPEVRRKFMEEVIRHDDLWTNLELNIWNAQRSDSPTPDSLRVFESCCTVIDLAFSVLEGSQDVDWRSPKFGSLAQRFELFITHYFQGAFMGRATSFRIGVIRARYCNAILAQFSKDLAHDSTLSFRSQWDVASLARLIFALGLRGEDEDDLKFWNSHISGGYVGADFTGKAEKMIKLAERDGPLLIICHLGHLVLDALPRDQSGLNLEDMKNVLKLQERVIENRRLPLNRASDTVWEGLGRLREQVEQLCRNSSDEDREILRHLLWIIGDAFNCRGEGPSLRELAEEHGQNIPAAVDPTSSGRSSGVSNLARSAPGPTAATSVEPSTGTETGEGGSYFIQRSGPTNRISEGQSDSPQSIDLGSLPPFYPTAQETSGGGTMGQSISAPALFISPVTPNFPYMGDARRRSTGPTVYRGTTLNPAGRANSAGTHSTPGIDSVRSDSAAGSPRGSPNPSDSGARSSSPPPSGPSRT